VKNRTEYEIHLLSRHGSPLWRRVCNEGEPLGGLPERSTHRMAVPGGWLYRCQLHKDNGVTMTFVPVAPGPSAGDLLARLVGLARATAGVTDATTLMLAINVAIAGLDMEDS